MRKLKLNELNRLDLEEYKSSFKLPVNIVLDNIRSAHNVGSIFRTVDGFALEKIILCGITARPPHKEINKTAIGATASVQWEYQEDISKTLEAFKEANATIVGVEQTTDSVSLLEYQFPRSSPIVLVFGNEVNGLSEAVLPFLSAAKC